MVLWKRDETSGEWESTRLKSHKSIPLGSSASLWLVEKGPCLLLAKNGVAVNGTPCGSFRHLLDKDEIRVGNKKFYVSYDPMPAVMTFSKKHAGLRCARCQGGLNPGEQGLACEGCGNLFHHSTEQPCFQYDARCCGCGNPTGGRAWEPEVE